jgi:hypothetical protein
MSVYRCAVDALRRNRNRCLVRGLRPPPCPRLRCVSLRRGVLEMQSGSPSAQRTTHGFTRWFGCVLRSGIHEGLG